MVELFSDGFEGGDFSAWTGTDGSPSIITTETNFFSLSAKSTTISGNPTDRHGFDVAHASDIVEVDKTVDGSSRKYLAYDSVSSGNGGDIRLYYSDDIAGTWTEYSGNPILSGAGLRTPTVAYVGGVFHMFVTSTGDKTIKRYTSADGITFALAETVLTSTEDEATLNPFIWLNPNDSKWYLFWRNVDGSTYKIYARNATDIADLDGAGDTTVLSTSDINSLAYPTITYRDGYYWLLTESYTAVWEVRAYRSNSVTSGYVEMDNSPILGGDEACPKIFLSPDGSQCFLFSNRDSANWYQDTREVYATYPTNVLYGSYTALSDAANEYCYMTGLDSASSRYSRAYFKFSALPSEDTYKISLMSSFNSQVNVRVEVYNDGGTVKWRISNSGQGDWAYSSSTVEADTKYCVEMLAASGGTNRLYVDGVEVANISSGASGTITTLYIGGWDKTDSINVYWDNVVIADAYIGVEAAGGGQQLFTLINMEDY